jgi:hypothetical protein
VPTFLAATATNILNIPHDLAEIPYKLATGRDLEGGQFKAREIIADMDQALGSNLEDYYTKHQEGIDMGAYVAASLVPGTLGVKALRAGMSSAKAGTGLVSKAIGGFDELGQGALKTAKLEAVSGNTPFNYLTKAAGTSFLAGAKVGVVETLAFNTAATLALHNSPYLDGKDAWELAKDAATDSLYFGSVAGGLFGATLSKSNKVGLLGYRQEMKPYIESRSALDALAGRSGSLVNAVESGAAFTAKNSKGVPKEAIIPDGDIAMALKENLDLLKQAGHTEDLIKQADEAGLFSKDAILREAEIKRIKSVRDSTIKTQEVKFDSLVKNIFKDVEDIVEVNSLIKQFKEGSLVNAASLLSGVKKLSLYTDELLDETGKLMGNKAIIDLETNTVVSSLAGKSIFDYGAKAQAAELAKAVTPPQFTVTGLETGNLTGMSGSIAYKKAIDAISNTVNSIAKFASSKSFTLNGDLAAVDVLVARAESSFPNLKFILDGNEVDVGLAKNLVAQRKIDLIGEALANGKAPEEMAAMLHMPEAKVMYPDLDGMINNLANKEGQAPRYIVGEYEKLVRSAAPNKFSMEAALDYKARIKLVKEERTLQLTSMFPELMKTGELPVNLYKGTGAPSAIKAADSKIGDVFQETLMLKAKLNFKLINDASSARVSQVDTAAEMIMAGGKTGEAYTEMAGITTWMQSAAQKGKGLNLWYHPDGRVFIVTRDLVEEALDAMKADAKAEVKSGANSVSEMLDIKFGSSITKGINRDSKIAEITTDEVAHYFKTHADLDAAALVKSNGLRRLLGVNPVTPGYTEAEIRSIYLPTPDKAKHPYALVVRGPEGHQNPVYAGQTKVLLFKSAEELAAGKIKMQSLGLEANTAADTKEFFKGIDRYENSLAFNGAGIKGELTSKHKLVIDEPETRSVEEFLDVSRGWHARSEVAIQRNVIALKYSDELVQMREISLQETRARDSLLASGTRSLQQWFDKTRPTPADQVATQLLGLKNSDALKGILKFIDGNGNGFINKLTDFAKAPVNALFSKKAEELTLDSLAKHYDSLGIEESYHKALATAANKPKGTDAGFDRLVRFSNMLLVNGQLRLDGLNSLVNAIGSPILGGSTVGLQLKEISKGMNPEQLAIFNKVLGVDEAGFMGNSVNFLKLAHKSIRRDTKLASDSILAPFAASARETLPQLYARLGITQNPLESIRLDSQQEIIDLMRSGKASESELSKIAKKTFSILTKPSDMVEGTLQFMAADAGLMIAEAAKAAGKNVTTDDALRLMNTVTQKLHGNFTASQKPGIFQGTIGAAVGLFQAYQARIVHRILDVVDSGDKRMLAEMAALQSGIFGVKSMPGFNQVNNYLVAANNEDNQDIYSGVFSGMDRAPAEALMYGTASSLLSLNLSTRGAVDFRAPSNITELPAWNIWAGMLGGAKQFVQQAIGGGDVSQAFSHAVQHNVFSRPIQQLAALQSGISTTGSGREAVNINDPKFNNPDAWMPNWATQTMRLLGGRPLDEAVYLDTVYRFNSFRMEDREKMDRLGLSLMTIFRDGGEPTPEQKKAFGEKFLAAGGTVKNFNSWYKRQLANSTTDAGERLRKMVKNSEEAKQLAIMLGADNENNKAINKEVKDVKENLPE